MLTVETFPCPCCEQTIRAHSLEALVDELDLTPHEESILRAVWERNGHAVTTAAILDAMFAEDPTGGPTLSQMYRAFNKALRSLRKRLEGTSIAVESAGYRQGYVLRIGGNDGSRKKGSGDQ